MGSALTTSQVAKQASVNPQTVRFYERNGLLPEPPRRTSGYRQYDDGHVRRILFIKRAQELGFTLQEIRELLELRADPEADRAEVKAQALHKMQEIEAKIQDLVRMKQTLGTLAEACTGHGSTDSCPILQALDRETS